MPTFTVRIPGGRLGNFLAGAAIASMIGGTAVAITSPDFTYSSAKSGRYSIAPGAMTPRDNTIVYNVSAGELSATAAGSGECFATGVNLPNGAVIVSIHSWYRSDSASDFGVFAYRHSLASNVATQLTPGYVVDDTDTRKYVTHTIPAALRTVDNFAYDYSYWVCLGTGSTFHGARINYTYRSAGD